MRCELWEKKHHTHKTNKPQIQYKLLDRFLKELFDHSSVYTAGSTVDIFNCLH